MRDLKIEQIILLCEEHKITAYEIGSNTKLDAAGVQRILNGETKKPREKTLDIILKYIENKITGSDIKETENNKDQQIRNLLHEPEENYNAQVLKEIITLHQTTLNRLQTLIDGQTSIINGVAETLNNTFYMKKTQIGHSDALNKIQEAIDTNKS